MLPTRLYTKVLTSVSLSNPGKQAFILKVDVHAGSFCTLKPRTHCLGVPNQKVCSHFIAPPATPQGCSYLDQDGNAFISLTSKFNYGLSPKGGLILATSPLHFYLKIKGTLGSINRRCIFVGPTATTLNKQYYRSLC